MANATGIRRSDEPLRTGHGFAEVNSESRDVRGRRERLIATVALEMDRLYERICESGCVLLLTDSDGPILHEKSNAMLRGAFRVQRIGSPGIRSLSPERDVAPVNYKTSQQALTLEDLAETLDSDRELSDEDLDQAAGGDDNWPLP